MMKKLRLCFLACFALSFCQVGYSTADSTSIASTTTTKACVKGYAAYLGMSAQDSRLLNGSDNVYLDGNNNPSPYTYYLNPPPGDPSMTIPICPNTFYWIDVHIQMTTSGGCGSNSCCFRFRLMTTTGDVLASDQSLGCTPSWTTANFLVNGAWVGIGWNPSTQGQILPPQIRTETSRDYGTVVQGSQSYIFVHNP